MYEYEYDHALTKSMAVDPQVKAPWYRPLTKAIGRLVRIFWSKM